MRRGHYKKQDVVDDLERLRHSKSNAEVEHASSVPLRTLLKKAKGQQSGIPIEELCRDTKPATSAYLEIHLVEWIAARSARPTCCPHRDHEARQHDLHRATESHESYPVGTTLARWYSRFLSRHLGLVPRTVQRISRVRNAVEKSSVDALYLMMAKLLIDNWTDSSWVFNMDETSFTTKPATTPLLPSKSLITCGHRILSIAIHVGGGVH